MAILAFLLVLSFLVILHEMGHFLAARKMGVKVVEFGLGYPPLMKKLFTWGETVFTLNWLPFGGFVQLFGDNSESFEKLGKAQAKQLAAEKHLHFEEKRAWRRLVVILAGPAINIIFGILAFTIIFSQIGIPTKLDHPKLQEVMKNTPAESVGLRKDDVMISVAGKSVKSTQDFIQEVTKHRGQTVAFVYEREGKQQTTQSYVRKKEETPANEGAFGVALDDVEFRHYPFLEMVGRSAVVGVESSIQFAHLLLNTLAQMMVDLVTQGKVSNGIAGPIGAVHSATKEGIFQQGWMAILNYAALLSINLGVMNLLPIPALDGGRAMFIFIERLLGKKRRQRWERKANTVGMAVLLVMIVLISLKDVWGIITDK